MLRPRALLTAVSALLLVNCVNATKGNGDNAAGETSAAPVPSAGGSDGGTGRQIANRCSIGILRCADSSVNLTTALSNPANAVSTQSCVQAASALRAQCQLPYPVPVSFFAGGTLQSSTSTF